MSYKTRFRQRKKRFEFDPRQLGAKCDECPYKDQQKAAPKPRSQSPGLQAVQRRASLLVLTDWPTEGAIAQGQQREDSTDRFVGAAIRASGIVEFDHETAILCRPETARDPNLKKAKECCRPRLERAIHQIANDGVCWILAAGPFAFQSATIREDSSEPWLGTPMEGYFPSTRVIPTHIPWVIRSKAGARFTAQFIAHIDRICQMALGLLKDFEWPNDILEEGEEMYEILESLAAAAERGEEISVDIETRGLGTDSDISCIGLARDNIACCVQLPCSPRGNRLLRRVLASGCMVGQNLSSFDRRVLRYHGYELTPQYEDTLLAATIINPQLPKNLGSLVSNEFHAAAWKAEYKTDEESGALGWTSTDPVKERERRKYCMRDAYSTYLLWQRFKGQLDAYK